MTLFIRNFITDEILSLVYIIKLKRRQVHMAD